MPNINSMTQKFLIILILLGQTALGQIDKTDSLFDNFKRNIEFERKENNGIIIWDDETKLSYLYLIQNSSNETLKKYTNDLDAAVRFYMFVGLTRKTNDSNDIKPLLVSHLNDTAKFSESTGCLVFINKSVIEEMKLAYALFSENTYNTYNDYLKTEIARIQSKPHLIINGLHHNVISKNDILKLDSLVYTDKSKKIKSFIVYIDKKPFENQGNAISKRIKRKLAKLKSGDIILLDSIKIVYENSFRKLGQIFLKIK